MHTNIARSRRIDYITTSVCLAALVALPFIVRMGGAA